MCMGPHGFCVIMAVRTEVTRVGPDLGAAIKAGLIAGAEYRGVERRNLKAQEMWTGPERRRV
jgi:hypothetical protein